MLAGETTLGSQSQYYTKGSAAVGEEDLLMGVAGAAHAPAPAPARALRVDISHFNVWTAVLLNREIRTVSKDCHFKHCG